MPHMVVSVWTRHSIDCPHRKDINYRRCGCPKHLHWHYEGRQFRKSAGTRSWEHALRRAQAIELQYRQRELGEKPKEHEAITAEKAVELYLADKTIQSTIFWVGGVPQEKWDAVQGDTTKLPSLHSAFWAPDAEQVIATATVSWKAVYVSGNTNVGGSTSSCETTSLVINNN